MPTASRERKPARSSLLRMRSVWALCSRCRRRISPGIGTGDRCVRCRRRLPPPAASAWSSSRRRVTARSRAVKGRRSSSAPQVRSTLAKVIAPTA